MSDYDELKKELHRVSRDIANKNREIKQLSDELVTIEKEKEAAKNSSDASLSADRSAKYKEHLSKLVGPIEQEILNVQKDIENEEIEFKDDFSSLTTEKFLEQCTDTQDLLKQIQEMSSELKTQLQDLVGARLYKNVYDNLSGSKIKLSVNDLDRAINYFNDCEDKVSAMLEKPDYIGNFVKKLEEKLSVVETKDSMSLKQTAILAVLLIASFVLLNKFVFPVYLIFIIFIGVFHVLRTYSVYEILIVQKAIADNIESIENKLRDEATDAANLAKAELQQEHDARMQFLKNKLNSLNEKQTNAMNASQDSFFYDSSMIQAALDGKLTNLDKREADAITNRAERQKELALLSSEYDEIKTRMDAVFSSQQNQYLNFDVAGEEFVFNPRFLLDIDDVTKKILFFDFPRDSALFIYKEREEAVDLIRLLNVQIRSKLHPSCYEVVYYDSINVGQDCFFFVPEAKSNNDPVSRLFRLISTEADFAQIITNYASEIKNRQASFRQDRNIDAYNQHMLEIESLTMPYYFAFVLDPDDSILKKLSIVTRAAGMYGIYICVFLGDAKMRELGRSVKDIVGSYNVLYAIQNGKVNTRAKDFILDEYSE